ncbi:MAG TPA: A/G-specific adenine glycosylase, partial [Acidimicrobiales bacterium]|nr:A/G-specific adenine glycosylase [Acidimicrobiales bacterium]
MTTSGRSDYAAFRRELRRAAPQIARPLPWIGHESAWAILVSEVMLQQTQTSRVVEPWTKFIERFPTSRSCADASLAEVLTAWRGLGYHRRAKALHDTARVLRDEFGDVVPSSLQELRTLPGVGEYTAAAVASFAYGEPVAVLDTNVGRVLARAISNRRLRPSEARALAADVLPRTHAAAFNQAMLDLGAQFCRSTPRCEPCPVAQHCAWRQRGGDDPAPLSAGVSRTQPRFEGSLRQLRGRVLNALREGPHSRRELTKTLAGVEGVRSDEVLD